jgi:hypothetical protein
MGVYSFLDVQATITGVGGSFSLGNGAGAAEEGLSIEMESDKNQMTVGADGSVMHSLHASKAGHITVRLLKTSPTNQKLSQMYAVQTASSATHGANVLVISNPVSGDVITATQCAFKKLPSLKYAKDGDVLEWGFDCGTIDTTLGGGLLANLISVATGLLT